jgi:hypothetical protein
LIGYVIILFEWTASSIAIVGAFTSFPKRRMKKLILISTVALAVIATAVILKEFLMLIKKKNRQSEGAPDMKFIAFEGEKKK